jgi:hypothetical protein
VAHHALIHPRLRLPKLLGLQQREEDMPYGSVGMAFIGSAPSLPGPLGFFKSLCQVKVTDLQPPSRESSKTDGSITIFSGGHTP